VATILPRVNWRQYGFPLAILGIAAIAGIVVLIASSGGDDDEGGTSAECREAEAPAPRQVQERDRPTLELDPGKQYRATVRTSCGTFVIELDPEQAPKTGGSFVTLARDGFYDGLGFHRIAPGFVIQGGDPAGDGTGGPGYTIRERPPEDVVYSKGVVAMAKGGDQPAGTSGSQFFVVTGDQTGLPPDYAVLGKVVSGMDAVAAIEAKSSSEDGPPSEPVVMDSVEIAETEAGGAAGQ
jgi:cyclophilin family peptidyl-prolyl cis-trans isomerase